jgi:hypothetical protein
MKKFKEYEEEGWIPRLEDLAVVISESKADASLKKKSKKTGIPFGILKQVFNRGKAAWRTGHRPGTNPENDKGNVIKLGFGDPNMEIKRDDPARRKSFRARHNCDNPGPKYKARYWSCYQWRAGAKVDN